MNPSSYIYSKKVWKEKRGEIQSNCNVALTTIYTSNVEDCYFDSGCSRHMIGNSLLFSDLKESQTGQVTFGDKAKDKVIGTFYQWS